MLNRPKNSPNDSAETKCAKLRQMVESPELRFLMEAHNGLSAKIVEEAGFEAIWASGLSMSASLGVRDSNEATWTQVLEVLEFMCDATSIPILVDGDTGYGDFNTMRRLIRKLESRGIAGVCIEDKCFPKTNSFIRGTSQPLAKIDEFCGKIKAGREAQSNDDFVIVARVEAFIAGWGLEEALKRAQAYKDAGADAILMHSALRNPSEVFSFLDQWENRLPVVLVPTKYFTTPTDEFRERNVSCVIWANHNLRSSISAMQATCERIFNEQNLESVEEAVVPVSEVFRLQGADELADAEKRFLPDAAANTRALIFAYTRGEEMGELTDDRPKAMVEISGKPLLDHIAEAYRSAGVRNLNIVRGYRGEIFDNSGYTLYDSQTTDRHSEVLALSYALDVLDGNVFISYGDVLFKKFIVTQLLDCDADFAVMIDTDWRNSRNKNRFADYAVCSCESSRASFYEEVSLKKVTSDASNEGPIHGEWMGFLKMSPRGSQILRDLIIELTETEGFNLEGFDMAALLNLLVERKNEIRVIYTTGNWLDCDSVSDAVDGSSFGK